MTLEKILTPKMIDGKKVTMRRFSIIKTKFESISGPITENELQRALIFAGAVRFEPKIGREMLWGLAVENLEILGLKNKDSIKDILENIEKEKELMPKYLAQIILIHPSYKYRKFLTIQKKLKGFKKDEIRRILVYAGALRFTIGGEEYWGLATRSLDMLGFAYKKPPKYLLEDMNNKSELMPYHLTRLLLEHPLYYRRTFGMIKQKLQGFKDNEIRSILVDIDAIKFKDGNGIEYWGLRRRNKEIL